MFESFDDDSGVEILWWTGDVLWLLVMWCGSWKGLAVDVLWLVGDMWWLWPSIVGDRLRLLWLSLGASDATGDVVNTMGAILVGAICCMGGSASGGGPVGGTGTCSASGGGSVGGTGCGAARRSAMGGALTGGGSKIVSGG